MLIIRKSDSLLMIYRSIQLIILDTLSNFLFTNNSGLLINSGRRFDPQIFFSLLIHPLFINLYYLLSKPLAIFSSNKFNLPVFEDLHAIDLNAE